MKGQMSFLRSALEQNSFLVVFHKSYLVTKQENQQDHTMHTVFLRKGVPILAMHKYDFIMSSLKCFTFYEIHLSIIKKYLL